MHEKRNILDELTENPFRDLQQSFKSFKRIDSHLKTTPCFKYIAPKKIEVVGPNESFEFQFVGVKEILKLLVSDPTFTPAVSTEDGLLRDIKDGSVYKNNPYFQQNPEAYTLILYSDAFEVCNPLGAKKGVNKLLNVYLVIAEMEKHHRSKTENLFLVLSVKDKHLKDNRSAIYAPLMKELAALETGIEHNGNVIKAGLLCQVGDNLEQHQIGGFSGNFAHGDICRSCHQQYDTLQEMAGAPTEEKWSREEYDSYCDVMETTPGVAGSCGLRSRCVFNTLKSFHCIGQLPFDIMHDYFECVGPVDGQAVIMAMVREQLFTLEQYNAELKDLPLHDYESGDKPLPVKAGALKLAGKAMSVALHLRLMPIILGNLLDEDHQSPAFALFLLLNKLCEFMLADAFSPEDVQAFQDVIIDFMEERKRCCETYGHFQTMKPKHHYLTHLPKQILEFGPCTNFWTARFESRHRDFVNFMESSKNWINILKTLCVKNQKKLACRAYVGLFSAPEIRFPGKKWSILETDGNLPIHLFSRQDVVADRVVVKNTLYRSGNVVALDMYTNDAMLVGVIVKIVIKNNKLHFLVSVHECVRHKMRFFEAFPLEVLKIIPYKRIKNFKPLIRRGDEECFRFVLHQHIPCTK